MKLEDWDGIGCPRCLEIPDKNTRQPFNSLLCHKCYDVFWKQQAILEAIEAAERRGFYAARTSCALLPRPLYDTFEDYKKGKEN